MWYQIRHIGWSSMKNAMRVAIRNILAEHHIPLATSLGHQELQKRNEVAPFILAVHPAEGHARTVVAALRYDRPWVLKPVHERRVVPF
mmetsp:Transcript_40410/g.116802  ORF Transcript_40410/g.116802 Transcript_40410/m.116802 type:complete len:88 (+) Transcript_40410:52-315(+)